MFVGLRGLKEGVLKEGVSLPRRPLHQSASHFPQYYFCPALPSLPPGGRSPPGTRQYFAPLSRVHVGLVKSSR